MRLAARRYLADLERARAPGAPFVFDPREANDACAFIEQLPHVEGEWDTPTIVLHPSHVFFVVNVFGFRKHLGGPRRFTSALLAVARKNAKSTIAAGILLYCYCCEPGLGPQAITAATTGSQARVVFNIAKRMVERTPDLREAFALEPFSNSIANWTTGGSFKPINAKASTQDGLNPSYVELDEIHAHKSHDLLNVLQSAAGARKNPLWLYTTTEGYETPGPWPELRRFTQQLLQEVFEADHFFGLIFSVDDEEGKQGDPDYYAGDDDFDEARWVKANPLMDVNPVLRDEVAKAAIDARAMPGRHAEFRIKRLNRQSSAATAWLSIPRWKACAGTVDLDALEGKPCFGAIDGAATTDLMSLRFVWLVDGVAHTWGRRWVPSDAVRQRTERGTLTYGAWVSAGWLTVLDGHTLDYEVIEEEIKRLCDRFKPRVVAYDPWNLRDLTTRLAKRLPMRPDPKDPGKQVSILQEFRQGVKTFSPAMKELERRYMSGALRHGNDPVLNWCMANIVPRYDENMNVAPDRKRSPDKIDDGVALIMAIGQMAEAPAPRRPRILLI